mmetsp:Transcript_27160/g.97026  ORF Transcript_27160/g.97026 Transcript_27160/m.97026 type:complete len:365 (-) Transcript_27160:79-1173(-)
MAAAYARQVGWLEARARHASETTSKVRAAEALEHTFEPILATRKKKSDAAARKPPEQTCSSAVAHASHVRRYAAARDEKARASAALTWSTSSHRKVAPPPPPPTSLARQPPDGSVAGTPSRLASPQRSASPRPEDVCDDDDGDVVDFTLCDDDAPTPAASPRTVLLAVCDDVAPDARLDGGGARVPAGLLSSSHFDIPQRFARSGEARPRRRPPQSDVAADAGAKTAWLAWRVKKTADDCIDIDIVSPPRHPADRRASLSAVGAPDAAARALILTPPWDRARSRNDDSPCPPRRITYLTIADDEEPGAPDTDAGRGGAPWRPAESAAPNAEQPRTLAEDDVVSAKLCSEASDYAKGKENLRHIA